MAVTLINTFIVPEDKEAEFLEHWKTTSRVFAGRPGFVETHLHRNTGIGNGTFRFINIARWESAEAWRSNHSDYVPGEYSIPGVKGHPAIFKCVVDMYGPTSAAESAAAPLLSAGFFPPSSTGS